MEGCPDGQWSGGEQRQSVRMLTSPQVGKPQAAGSRPSGRCHRCWAPYRAESPTLSLSFEQVCSRLVSWGTSAPFPRISSESAHEQSPLGSHCCVVSGGPFAGMLCTSWWVQSCCSTIHVATSRDSSAGAVENTQNSPCIPYRPPKASTGPNQRTCSLHSLHSNHFQCPSKGTY